MRGQMMYSPLLVTSFIDRAGELFGSIEIVSRRADRSIHRYTYKECCAVRAGALFRRLDICSRRVGRSLHRYTYKVCCERARRLAMALHGFWLQRRARVATLMCNHYAHVEAYFGIPLAGGVFHTLN